MPAQDYIRKTDIDVEIGKASVGCRGPISKNGADLAKPNASLGRESIIYTEEGSTHSLFGPALLRAIPAYMVSFVGGWLISALDPVQTQLVVSFGLTSCDDLENLDCVTGKDADYKIAGTNSALFIGAVIGCLTCRFLAEKGRRFLLLMISALVIPGCLIAGFAPDGQIIGSTSMLWVVALGRLISGVGVGWVCVSVPLYVSEVVPNSVRGAFLTAQWLMQGVGGLAAVIFGLGLRPPPGDTGYENSLLDQWWWRLMILIPVPLSLISIFCLLFATETPYILLKRGKDKEAQTLLADINGSSGDDLIKEFEITKASADRALKLKKDGGGAPLTLMRSNFEYVHALLVGMGLASLQNLSGARALTTSSSRLFTQAGLSPTVASYTTVAFLATNVLGNSISVFTMDKAGRKTNLIISFGGQAVFCLMAAMAYWIDPEASATTVIAVVALFLFFFSFAIGVGPIPCMYLSEIFPADFKGFGMGMGAACNWSGIAIMTFVSLVASNEFIFSLFFVISALGVLFVVFLVRETTGRSVYGSPYFKEPLEMGPSCH
eukprot:Clim_evm47s198 gene=Clim_evmTU47s198